MESEDQLMLWWTEVWGDQSPGQGLAGSPDHHLSHLQVWAGCQGQDQDQSVRTSTLPIPDY